MKPSRTFNGVEGQPSVGTGGPDQIEYDLDNAFAALDPAKKFKDGSAGGIGIENCKDEVIKHKHVKADITDFAHTHDPQTCVIPSNTKRWSYVVGINATAEQTVFTAKLPWVGRYRFKIDVDLAFWNGTQQATLTLSGADPVQLTQSSTSTVTIDMTSNTYPGNDVTLKAATAEPSNYGIQILKVHIYCDPDPDPTPESDTPLE